MSAAVAPLAAQRKRRARIAVAVIVVLVLAAIGIAVPFVLKSTASTDTAPTTVAAETRTITAVVSGSGSTVAADSVTVNPEVSGTIEELYVSLGETVSAGDELYSLSSDDADAALLRANSSLLQAKQSKLQAEQAYDQANAQLYSAKTQKISAQQKLDRLESQPSTSADAADAIVIAKRDVVAATKSVNSASKGVTAASVGKKVASANYTSAKQDYDDAAADVDKTLVLAPIDGTITSLPLSVGDYVSAGASSGSSSGASGADAATSASGSSASSIVIADLTELAVEISVSEVDVADLSVGKEATVTIDALSGQTLAGAVKSISPNGTATSGVVSYQVEISLSDTDKRLRPDMSATADIITQLAENAVAVPNSAIKSDGTTKYVQVLTSAGATEKRTITVGISDETYTQVTEGLAAGDAVLTATATSSSSSTAQRGPGGGFMMGAGGPPSGGRGGE